MSVDNTREQEHSPRPVTIQDVHDALSHGMGMRADGGGWHHEVEPNNPYRSWIIHSVIARNPDTCIGALVTYTPPPNVLRPARGLFGGEIPAPSHRPLFGEGSLHIDQPTQALIAPLQALARAREDEGFAEQRTPDDGGPSWASRTGIYSQISFMFLPTRDLMDQQRPVRLTMEGQLDTLVGSSNWPFVTIYADLGYAELLTVLEQSGFFEAKQKVGALDTLRRRLGIDAIARTLRGVLGKT